VRLIDMIRGGPKPTKAHENEPRELRVQRIAHRATLRKATETIDRIEADFARFEQEARDSR
jgi:hypothetical protein